MEQMSFHVTADEKQKAEDAINALNESIKGEDIPKIQDATAKLYESMNPITKAKSEAEAAAEATTTNETTKPNDDDIVDAEVKETKNG